MEHIVSLHIHRDNVVDRDGLPVAHFQCIIEGKCRSNVSHTARFQVSKPQGLVPVNTDVIHLCLGSLAHECLVKFRSH